MSFINRDRTSTIQQYSTYIQPQLIQWGKSNTDNYLQYAFTMNNTSQPIQRGRNCTDFPLMKALKRDQK